MTDSELVASDRLREILAGCDGVTGGPWQVYDGCSWRRIGTAASLGRDYDDCAVLYPNVASDGHPDMHAGRGQDTYANLNHIARLDPQTVASIVIELLALREAADTREAIVAWRWASSNEWRVLSPFSSEAARTDFIRDMEKTAPIVVQTFYASPREGHVEVPRDGNDLIERVDAIIETLRFNSQHMIAERSLQDAWKMLDMAREQWAIDANTWISFREQLRAYLSRTKP